VGACRPPNGYKRSWAETGLGLKPGGLPPPDPPAQLPALAGDSGVGSSPQPSGPGGSGGGSLPRHSSNPASDHGRKPPEAARVWQVAAPQARGVPPPGFRSGSKLSNAALTVQAADEVVGHEGQRPQLRRFAKPHSYSQAQQRRLSRDRSLARVATRAPGLKWDRSRILWGSLPPAPPDWGPPPQTRCSGQRPPRVLGGGSSPRFSSAPESDRRRLGSTLGATSALCPPNPGRSTDSLRQCRLGAGCNVP